MDGSGYRYLFNFAVSHSGGGLKRLQEFARWFDAHGGGCFIIHQNCVGLVSAFPNNRFWIVSQSRHQRLLNDCSYLSAIEKEIGHPDLYYSYGIPIYRKVGKKNWFHLSNVLPLVSRSVPLSTFDRVKLAYLGIRIKKNLHHAEIISAESRYSLSLIKAAPQKRLVLSINGSDDELRHLRMTTPQRSENVATIVGTYGYKGLEDSYRVFQMLQKGSDRLRLVIIGDEQGVPRLLRRSPFVEIRGILQRSDVLESLRTSRYYISTTHIENSFNAAAEGTAFAEESFISDIGPHRELLEDSCYDVIRVPGMTRPVLQITRAKFSASTLKFWEEIIAEMITEVQRST
jgi:glycosyltransferase involved in cell wall biosynthesis